MTGPDPFEERLRDTLHSSDPQDTAPDRPDVEAFLTDVHRGARSRRRRRTAGVIAAATVVVAGAAGAGAIGVLSDDGPPIADGPTATTADTSTETPTTELNTGSPAGESIESYFNAGNTDVVSVTSTDDTHQWALTETQIDRCRDICYSVASRSPATGEWGSPVLMARGAVSDVETQVSQLRYVADAAGGYDGWVFGPALYSIHGVDGGSAPAIWQSVDVGGSVTGLEPHGATVYALVESAGRSTLMTSQTDQDAFEAVDTGPGLGEASSLVVTRGVVAFIDQTDTGFPVRANVVSSPADPTTGQATGDWSRSQPCPSGSEPISLSSASDALWALCSDGDVDTVAYRASGAGAWTEVPSYRTGTGSLLTARSTDSAVLDLADNTELLLVTATGATTLGDTAPPFMDPTMLGFTNPDLGFAVTDAGDLWRTEDGGRTWTQEQVIPD